MQTIEITPERERELRRRLVEFTEKMQQALTLVQEQERRQGAAPREK